MKTDKTNFKSSFKCITDYNIDDQMMILLFEPNMSFKATFQFVPNSGKGIMNWSFDLHLCYHDIKYMY